MLPPKPDGKKWIEIVSKIDAGLLLIPRFQRDFVWSMKDSAKLIDSILQGYPIGTFVLWHTDDRMRSMRKIAGQSLPDPKEGVFVDFVLDGQQRLASLYACFTGCKVKRESGKSDDFKQIVLNLDTSDNEQIVLTKPPKSGGYYIPVHRLYEGRSSLFKEIPEEFHDDLDRYRDRIMGYEYSVIQLTEAPIEVATEVFTRINTGGKPLGLFEIMVAKTYDRKKEFDLLDKWAELEDSLKGRGYETVSRETVLGTVALIAEGSCQKRHVLKMDRKPFIDSWDKTKDAILYAVDHLCDSGLAPVSSMLPYDALIPSFAYFFSQQRHPNAKQTRLLEDFFWRVALTNRYIGSMETKLTEDIRHMNAFLQDEEVEYGDDWGVDLSFDYIKSNGQFSTGYAYAKAILCLYASQQPQSFRGNQKVNVDNSNLQRSNGRNYHHFFPKKFLKEQGREDGDHVLNITLIEANLNMGEIGANPPSVYMGRFKEKNPQLADTMRTHLISDMDGFGVFKNDYDEFLRQRAEAVRDELSKRMIFNEKIDRAWKAASDN